MLNEGDPKPTQEDELQEANLQEDIDKLKNSALFRDFSNDPTVQEMTQALAIVKRLEQAPDVTMGSEAYTKLTSIYSELYRVLWDHIWEKQKKQVRQNPE